MNKDLSNIASMINGTSQEEMQKWGYEFQEYNEPITLCDVRREIEKITGNEYNTTDILESIKEAGGTIVPRNEDGRYDLTYVNVQTVIENIIKK